MDEKQFVFSVNDFHNHTAISPCAPRDSRAMGHINNAIEFGLTKIGFSDHTWDMAVPGQWDFYNEQSIENTLSVKETIEPQDKVKVYIGCEVDMREDCTIAMLPEHLHLFDYVLIPTDHFHMDRNTPREAVSTDDGVRKILLDRFTAAVNSPLADYGRIGLCHPFIAASFGDRENSILGEIKDRTFEELFTIAAKRNIYIEINATMFGNAWLKRDGNNLPGEYVRIFTLAANCGCKIYFGSDSHHADVFRKNHTNPQIQKFADVCGIKFTDLV